VLAYGTSGVYARHLPDHVAVVNLPLDDAVVPPPRHHPAAGGGVVVGIGVVFGGGRGVVEGHAHAAVGGGMHEPQAGVVIRVRRVEVDFALGTEGQRQGRGRAGRGAGGRRRRRGGGGGACHRRAFCSTLLWSLPVRSPKREKKCLGGYRIGLVEG